MLHSTDAGEMAVITAYAQTFTMEDPTDGYSKAELFITEVVTMRWY